MGPASHRFFLAFISIITFQPNLANNYIFVLFIKRLFCFMCSDVTSEPYICLQGLVLLLKVSDYLDPEKSISRIGHEHFHFFFTCNKVYYIYIMKQKKVFPPLLNDMWTRTDHTICEKDGESKRERNEKGEIEIEREGGDGGEVLLVIER